MLVGQLHGFMMATGQRLGLAAFAAAIDRTYRVDNVFGCEPSACGDHCLSGGQSANFADDLAAFGEDRWPSSVVNRTIDSAAAQQG